MISDLHKFIETLHTKGKELFAAYSKLKEKLDDLKITLDKLKVDGEHQQEVLAKLKEEIEEWKSKARELQIELDELKSRHHDLQSEEHELNLKNAQLTTDINVIKKENEGMISKIDKIMRENEELNKRIVELEHIKEKVEVRRSEKNKLQAKIEKQKEKLEKVKDDLSAQRIENLKNRRVEDDEEVESKDTHVDLNMEMYITHNKTVLYKPTYAPVTPYSTETPYYKESSVVTALTKTCPRRRQSPRPSAWSPTTGLPTRPAGTRRTGRGARTTMLTRSGPTWCGCSQLSFQTTDQVILLKSNYDNLRSRPTGNTSP